MNTFQQKIFATICAIVIILPFLSIDQITPANNHGASKIPLLRGDVEGFISDVRDTNKVEYPLSPQPDLIVKSFDRSMLLTNNQALTISGTISAEVENQGDAATAMNFDIAFFEDNNGNGGYETLDNLLGSTTYSGVLNPGAYTTVSASVSGSVLFRDNLIYAFVDSGNVIVEDDETNNLRNTGQDCEYRPPTGIFNPVLEWAWTGSSFESAWDQVMCAPAVGNLNDDNGDGKVDDNDIPDIIFNTWKIATGYWKRGRLRAISGDGSGELFTIISHWTAPGCSPAIGDIDKDGLPEIIVLEELTSVGATITYLLVFENDGTLKWKTSSNYNFGYYGHIAGPSIADLDEDGTPEIIIGNYVFNNDGTLRWHGTGSSGLHISTIANLDMAGHPEVVAGNTAYYFDGTIYWQNAIVPEGRPAVGNFDDDIYPEIVVVGNGNISMLEHDGTLKWGPFDIEPPGTYRDFGGPPTIADFDGDGHVEIGVAGGYRYVVYEGNGTVMWSNITVDYSSSQTGSSVFDFEGDGSAEVVYADEEYLRIYKGSNGEVLWEYLLGSGTLLELPLIVDVDNDNNAEIVMICNDYVPWSSKTGVYIFGDANDNWVNTRKIWNQHAYHITNINNNATIPQYEKNNWEIYNNFRCQGIATGTFGTPDFSSCYIRINDTSYPTSIDVTARIGNGGAVSVTAGVSIAFYDGDPGAGGSLVGTMPTSIPLAPGQYEDVTITWLGPIGGYHNFFAVADDDGTGNGSVSECCELNNIWHHIAMIGVFPPVANAGDDQITNEGDLVQFDGTGSYSPGGETRTWSFKTNIPSPTWGPGSATLDEQIYYVGGNPLNPIVSPSSIFMKYDPITDSWSNLTNLPAPRAYLGAATAKGKIYAIGGTNGNQSTDTVFEFDPSTNIWTTKSPMPIPMEAFGIAVVKDRIYVIGGYSSWVDCYPCSNIFEYNPINDSWLAKPDMPTGRAYLAAAVLEDKIYAIGGDAYGTIGAVEVYDPDTETWAKRANMSIARSGLSAETLGRKIYIFGGTAAWALPTNVTEIFDPFDDSWTLGPSMLEPRMYFGSGVVGGCLYAMGGSYGPLIVGIPNSTEEYCVVGGLRYEWDFDAFVDSDGDGNYINDVQATDLTPTWTYGDNGVYVVTLTVTDDQNLSDTDICNITVLNVNPMVTIESAIMNVEFGLRVAGSKWSNVGLTLYENDTEIGYLEVERWPGSPDDNPTYENPALPTTLDMTKSYKAIVTYDPYPDNNDEIKGDQPNNGKDKQNNAGNPIWIIIKFSDGSEEKIHHTFNTQQSKKRNSDHWNHVEPWEVDLNRHFVGHEFEITSHITDPGSDDETLTYTYGSQVVTFTYLNNPPDPDPFPSPEVNPMDIMDTTRLTYEGPGTLSLLLEDDDGGKTIKCLDLG